MENQVRPPQYKFIVAMFHWPGLFVGMSFIACGLWVEQESSWEHRVAIGHFLAEVGAVWLALATLHMAYEWKMVDRIVQVVRRDSETMHVCDDLGIVRVLPELSARSLQQPMAMAKKRIRVLKTFFPEDENFMRLLESLFEKSSPSVDLYLLEPGSSILDQRSVSLPGGRTLGARDKVKAAIEVYCNSAGSRGHRIVLFDAWPGCPVVQCDDVIYAGHYLIGSASPHQPWIKVGRGSKLYGDLEKQFEMIDRDLKPTHIISDVASGRAFLTAYEKRQSENDRQTSAQAHDPAGVNLSGTWTFSIAFEPSKNVSHYVVNMKHTGGVLDCTVEESKTLYGTEAKEEFQYRWTGHFRDRIATLSGRSSDPNSIGAHTVIGELIGSGETLDCTLSRYCYKNNRINTSVVQWTKK